MITACVIDIKDLDKFPIKGDGFEWILLKNGEQYWLPLDSIDALIENNINYKIEDVIIEEIIIL